MWFKTNILLFILFTGIFAKAQNDTECYYLNNNGIERSFEVYIPNTYSAAKAYPLVFVLHGGGGKAKGIILLTKKRFNVLAKKEQFIVVYPSGFEKSWNDGARDTLAPARKYKIDDVDFFRKMIRYMENNFSIQNNNIFACGISNGGFMVQRL